MQITSFRSSDVPDAFALSVQADWNQTRADWYRLAESPAVEGFAGRADGDIVATATVATYDSEGGNTVGWIGMVLVATSHRRRGYGMAITTRALEWATAQLDDVGLDATKYGRPLYRELGFEDVASVDRWLGVLSPLDDCDRSRDVERVGSAGLGDVLAFDRTTCGVDRGHLLEGILDDPESTGFVVRDGAVRGFAVLRPGREHFHLGPVVARSPRDCATLLDAAARHLDGTPVYVDVVEGAGSALERHDMSLQRELTRMTHGDATASLLSDEVMAITGFEWG